LGSEINYSIINGIKIMAYHAVLGNRKHRRKKKGKCVVYLSEIIKDISFSLFTLKGCFTQKYTQVVPNLHCKNEYALSNQKNCGNRLQNLTN